MSPSYTFGDGDIASRRLGLLSEVFAPTSRRFLSESVGFRPKLALDLGCGPGHTTHMISDTLAPLRTVGVELSEAFLSEAKRTEREGVEFVGADVTARLPVTKPDLIYARFLLTHLPEPERAVRNWRSELHPDGLLLLEEVEEIRTSEPTLARYLELLAAMLAHHGHELYIGPRLDDLCRNGDLACVSSRISRLTPTVGKAAGMFSMNLVTWRGDEFVRENFSGAEIDALETDLLRLTGSDARGSIVWHLRQIVLRRD